MCTDLSKTGLRRCLVVIAVSSLVLAAFITLLGSSSAQAKDAAQNRVTAPSITNDRDSTSSSQGISIVTDVSIVDFAFDPQVVTITAGSSVRWTNNGLNMHTSTSNTGVWDSGVLNPGDMFTMTFNTPGTYPYHCAIHPFMHGTVVVLSPAQPPTAVSIAGSTEITVNTAYAFTATVSPVTATLPITFYWQATGQSPMTDTEGEVTDTVTFTWPSGATGAQFITATAINAGGSLTGTHVVLIAPQKVYLPLVVKSS